HPLLLHRAVEAGVPVADRQLVVRLVQVLRLPVARRRTRELPAAADRIGGGVVVNDVYEVAGGWQVLEEARSAVAFRHPLALEVRIVRREDVEDRAIELQEVPLGRGLVDDLRE